MPKPRSRKRLSTQIRIPHERMEGRLKPLPFGTDFVR